MNVFHLLRQFLHVIFDFSAYGVYWLLHITFFQGKPGEIFFYNLDKEPEEMPPSEFDGKVLVIDKRFEKSIGFNRDTTPNCHRLYGYSFENRYYRRMPKRIRVLAIWTAMLRMDSLRPLLIMEKNDGGLTPYGDYPILPPTYRRWIQEALNPNQQCSISS